VTEPIVVEKFAVGQSVRRLEDPRLLQGLGRYSDDVSLPRETHAVLARSPHAHARIRTRTLLAHVLEVPQSQVRVVTGDLGGSFGMRSGLYPEMVLVLWAARRRGRPVKWTSDRREGFLTDEHGRDNLSMATLPTRTTAMSRIPDLHPRAQVSAGVRPVRMPVGREQGRPRSRCRSREATVRG
jgi:CO/xanthine dehydrogenase Mo-binding subunit